MKLYLLRHGTAEPRGSRRNDPNRQLVAKGEGQSRQVARLLARMGALPEVVVTSPYARALQTAEALLREADLDLQPLLEPLLEPGTAVSDAAAALMRHGAARVLAVGHEPLLSELAAHLIGGPPQLSLDLRKGGLVELSVQSTDPPRATLEGWLRPKHLKK